MKRLLCFTPLFLICFVLSACSPAKPSKSVTIASKQFAENVLLSEMYAQLIESYTDIEVVRMQRMGNAACFPAMEAGVVDIYVEYTGTIFKEILSHEEAQGGDARDFFDMISKELYDTKGITVYDSIGPNNTYALAMSEDYAGLLGVEAMSDLSFAAPELVFGANEGFFARVNDGYELMLKTYGLSFKSTVQMDTPSLYSAVGTSQVDVMVAYATDSQLKEYRLVVLEDDKRFFPEYYAVPLVRNEALQKFPELNGVMNVLASRIDDERMQELNYMVDFEGKSVEDVAKVFLTEEGLLR